MKLKYLIGLYFILTSVFLTSQNENSNTIKNKIKLSLNMGFTHHGNLDSFYYQDKNEVNRLFGVNVPIKYKYLLNSSFKVKYNLLSINKLTLGSSLGIENYVTRRDMTYIVVNHSNGDTTSEIKKFRNANFALNFEINSSIAMFENKMNLNFGIYSNRIIYSVEKFGFGTNSLGFLIGVDKKVFNKHKIGISLHQRIWYVGLNREINRISLNYTF